MTLTLRVMTPADIPHGMRLKAENHWNQLEADWRRQLALEPDACFLAEFDGKPVGTACATVFGPVAWVAMVLVNAGHRGHGIGTALMKQVLRHLDERGVPSIRLDATPLGRPVYEKLGFVAEYELHRFEGIALRLDTDSIARPERSELPQLVALDRAVTATDRSKLLSALFAEQPNEFRWMPDAGFVAARPGARAWQLGPCVGETVACHSLLLDALGRHANEPIFADIPAANAAARSLAESHGLAIQRPLLRMGRGLTIKEDLQRLWTSFGPEKG